MGCAKRSRSQSTLRSTLLHPLRSAPRRRHRHVAHSQHHHHTHGPARGSKRTPRPRTAPRTPPPHLHTTRYPRPTGCRCPRFRTSHRSPTRVRRSARTAARRACAPAPMGTMLHHAARLLPTAPLARRRVICRVRRMPCTALWWGTCAATVSHTAGVVSMATMVYMMVTMIARRMYHHLSPWGACTELPRRPQLCSDWISPTAHWR